MSSELTVDIVAASGPMSVMPAVTGDMYCEMRRGMRWSVEAPARSSPGMPRASTPKVVRPIMSAPQTTVLTIIARCRSAVER